MTGSRDKRREDRPVDLHVHTTASDGLLTPAQAVDTAAACRLAALGVADHDTVAGVAEALERAASIGPAAPEIVPAVEINTDFMDREIHILGYFIDWLSDDLVRTLEELRNGRLERAARIVERLSEMGLVLSLRRIVSLAEEGSVGRPHVARAMVEAGYVGSVGEAFERYLGRGRPAFVERRRFSPVEAVETVRRARGVPVLAHPGQDATPSLIEDLIRAGLEGVEVYHPDHGVRERSLYSALAAEKGLVATGGSDSHGPMPAYGAAIGAVTVAYRVVEELRLRKERRRDGESEEQTR